MIWTWTGVSSCSLLSMPMTQLSYLSTIYLSISAERRLFRCHEESAGNLHDKEFGKKLSGLSVHSQPKSGANVTVCGFSVPQFEERLKRRRSVLTELLYYFASFDLKCSFTLLEKPSVSAGVTDTIRSYARGLRACGWRWRRNAVEITLYLSLPSPFVFCFFLARFWALILPRSRLGSVTKDAKHEIGSPACGRQIPWLTLPG